MLVSLSHTAHGNNAQARSEAFTTADEDGDGFLSPDELVGTRLHHPLPRPKRSGP